MIIIFKKSFRRTLKKGIALLVCAAFLATSLSLPQARAEVSALPIAFRSLAGDLTAIDLPQEIGKIEEIYRGTGDKIMVLIQDAHSIPDAQRSIRSAIDHFQSQYGISFVGLEGASEKLDPQIFRSFPDKKLLRKTLDAYAQRGELTGGTAAAIFSAGQGPDGSASGGNASSAIYHGIEDWPLYEEGISYYLKAMGMETEIMASLHPMMAALNTEKEKIYSKDLLAIDQLLIRFGENKTDLVQVLNQLSQYQRPPKDSELALLTDEIQRSQTADAPLEIDIKKIAEQVASVLRSRPLSAESRQKLQEFNGKFQEFLTAGITPEVFALYLKGVVKKYGIRVTVSRKIAHLVENQKRLKDIEGTRLFEEFKRYANAVKEPLFQNDQQKALDRQTRGLELIQRLTRLELSFSDWQKVQKMMLQLDRWTVTQVETPMFSTRSRDLDDPVSQDRVVSREEISALLKKMEPHLAFYRVAEKRDQVFLKNTQALMGKQMKASSGKRRAYRKNKSDGILNSERPTLNAAILVAGGFHTEGLTQTLKEKGISYVLVMPSIGVIPEEPLYREHMQGKVSWSDYFEVKDGKVNLYDAFVRGARDTLLGISRESSVVSREGKKYPRLIPQDPRLLKNWRDQIIRDLAAEGRITQASEYTRFIDELLKVEGGRRKVEGKNKPGSTLDLRHRWLANIDRFGAGLKKLQTEGHLSESSIANLIKTITTAEPVLMPLANRSIDARLLGLAEVHRPFRDPKSYTRSEVRAKSDRKSSSEGLQNQRSSVWEQLAHLISLGVPLSMVTAYDDSIRSAEARGDIVYGPTQRRDLYSALSNLTSNNMDKLTDRAKYLLWMIKDELPPNKRLTLMDAGAGAGRAAREMNQFGEVDTISLSPISPTWGLIMAIDQIVELARQEGVFSDSGYDPFNGFNALAAAFILYQGKHPPFEVHKTPFVRRQFIGDFPSLDIEEKYDFIFDKRGIVFNDEGSGESREANIGKLLELLSEDGIYYTTDFPRRGFSLGSDLRKKFVAIEFNNGEDFVAFRKESKFRERYEKFTRLDEPTGYRLVQETRAFGGLPVKQVPGTPDGDSQGRRSEVRTTENVKRTALTPKTDDMDEAVGEVVAREADVIYRLVNGYEVAQDANLKKRLWNLRMTDKRFSSSLHKEDLFESWLSMGTDILISESLEGDFFGALAFSRLEETYSAVSMDFLVAPKVRRFTERGLKIGTRLFHQALLYFAHNQGKKFEMNISAVDTGNNKIQSFIHDFVQQSSQSGISITKRRATRKLDFDFLPYLSIGIPVEAYAQRSEVQANKPGIYDESAAGVKENSLSGVAAGIARSETRSGMRRLNAELLTGEGSLESWQDLLKNGHFVLAGFSKQGFENQGEVTLFVNDLLAQLKKLEPHENWVSVWGADKPDATVMTIGNAAQIIKSTEPARTVAAVQVIRDPATEAVSEDDHGLGFSDAILFVRAQKDERGDTLYGGTREGEPVGASRYYLTDTLKAMAVMGGGQVTTEEVKYVQEQLAKTPILIYFSRNHAGDVGAFNRWLRQKMVTPEGLKPLGGNAKFFYLVPGFKSSEVHAIGQLLSSKKFALQVIEKSKRIYEDSAFGKSVAGVGGATTLSRSPITSGMTAGTALKQQDVVVDTAVAGNSSQSDRKGPAATQYDVEIVVNTGAETVPGTADGDRQRPESKGAVRSEVRTVEPGTFGNGTDVVEMVPMLLSLRWESLALATKRWR